MRSLLAFVQRLSSKRVRQIEIRLYRTLCYYIGVGSKFEVQRPCCTARSAAEKCKIISPRIFSKCAPLDCKIKLSNLPNRPVKYLKNSKIIRTDFVVVPRRLPSFRRLSVKMCTSLVPSHLTAQDFDCFVVYFKRKCTHVTAYETGATKRLLELRLVPRERG